MFEARGRCTWAAEYGQEVMAEVLLAYTGYTGVYSFLDILYSWIWASHFPKMSCSHMFLGVYFDF